MAKVGAEPPIQVCTACWLRGFTINTRTLDQDFGLDVVKPRETMINQYHNKIKFNNVDVLRPPSLSTVRTARCPPIHMMAGQILW